jgi:predicted Zn-dependent protease
MQFEADYYDGISPRAKRVLVSVMDSHFVIKLVDGPADALSSKLQRYAVSSCDVQAQLGSGKRLIDLPDGGRLETNFLTLEECLPVKKSSIFWRAVHYAETHKSIILIAFSGILIASVLLLQYGIPMLAKYTAKVIPESVELQLGQQTLDTLDQKNLGYFDPSRLPMERKQAITKALADMCQKTKNCPIYQLNFRKSEAIGANAFALPGGFIVITDELIELSKNNDEIIAVLAHELGHVKKRHALRQALQGTISGLVIIAITGDVSNIAAGLPALMLNLSYTRELETEADNYALTSLETACIPTKSFATILLRLEKSHGAGAAAPEMISSHPDTKKRVLPFLKHKNNC